MKKLLILIVLLTGIIATCKAQERKTPLMITPNRENIAFFTDLVTKPITVVLHFKIYFTSWYHPGDSIVNIKSTELQSIAYRKYQDKGSFSKYKLITPEEQDSFSPLEQYMWSICNGFIKEWMKDQPYIEVLSKTPESRSAYMITTVVTLLPISEYKGTRQSDNNRP